ncbi:hypothetical protein BPLS_P4821 [Bathymodiolus platifrons methanotrophic gill symbiont]|uniref:S8 family serine peptidase n=1 Tax=Bathymodiolus platifrons methanotrophic gill symbiont TaxID=113268 RepID=UPI001B681515|nr:S8 family serine peptidase [Bathymodiolus platifrons methanotrophic gill symbiont]GFO76806.1 hypothetical protein BPLS_P4821 [Bathymodiolus platifrons methanotrophic gill symbiont]
MRQNPFKTPDDGSAPLITPPPSKEDYYGNLSGFGEYIGQITKQELKNELNIKGEVVSIFGSINAVHVKVDENEASRLSRDKRVLLVEKDRLLTTSTTQTNPGWGLDRIDDATPTVDNEYTYSMTGLGRTIYVLDSGLNLGTKDVDDEFEGRATFLWDVNGKGGNDCQSHGSKVSSAAAGRRYGVAKGANLIIVKITNGCSKNSNVSTSVLAFNWLATNAPAGSIINWSHGFNLQPRLNDSIKAEKIKAASKLILEGAEPMNAISEVGFKASDIDPDEEDVSYSDLQDSYIKTYNYLFPPY